MTYFVPTYAIPGVYQTAVDASKNIRVRISYVNGVPKIETITNANNPGGCDQARAAAETLLSMSNDAVSATAKHPVEEHITTPSPEQVEEVKQIKKTNL